MTIPASYSETRKYDHTKIALSDAVSKALESIGWEFEFVDPDFFIGKIPRSIWSWGENFEIHIEENGNIRMLSICSFRSTIISWGKNKRNVRIFFSALDENPSKILLIPVTLPDRNSPQHFLSAAYSDK